MSAAVAVKTFAPMRVLCGLVTALRTLSILPVPGKDAPRLADALYWFSLAGGLLGFIAFGACWGILRLSGWPEGAAALAIAAGALISGGMHLDGLADCADALPRLPEPAKALEVMKDPRVGAFGVLSVVLDLLLKWSALARLCAIRMGLCLVGSYIVSRAAIVYVAYVSGYARKEGGVGAAFVEGAGGRHLAIALCSAALLMVLLDGPFGLAILLVGWLVAAAFGDWYGSRLGGVTGDVLGACCELAETITLFVYAAIGERMLEYFGWWGGLSGRF